MSDAGFFRGTSAEQDNRFSDKEKKLLKQMKFGENVLKKVDMSKVKLDVLRPWISKRVEDMLGMEDDVIEEFVVNQLEANQFPDGRRIQINLTGFLNGKNARIFTAELWDMLLSAQEQSTGIPTSIIESKQEEIKKRNEEQDKINETLKKTASRVADQLKQERNSPPLPSSRSHPPSSSSAIKREQDFGRDQDFNRRRDDGGRRQYRPRRSSSNSPPRRSRSRSRDRRDRRGAGPDRSEPRRDRDRARDTNRDNRGRDNRDRSRDRARRNRSISRSPLHFRRSPIPARSSYRDRSKERDQRNTAFGSAAGRRNSDYERDRDRRDINRRRSSRSGSREDFRNRRSAQNGSSQYRPRSPSPALRAEREKDREMYRLENATPMSPNRRRDSNNRESASPMPIARPLMEEPQNSDDSADSGAEESSPARKTKKDKKNKKEKKKHKKHKKTKKSKKSSKNGSGDLTNSEEEDDEDQNDNDNGSERDSDDSRHRNSIASSSLLKYMDTVGGEALEKKLRAKALESLKKANSSH